MTTPLNGPISAQDVNFELGRFAGDPFSMDESAVRTLAEKPSGTISFQDLRGKTASGGGGWGVGG